MSVLFDWRSALVRSDLPAMSRHVALTLSLHMNEEGGSCFPSIDTIASETGLTTRAVRLNMSRLVETGWVVVKRGGGRGRSNRYHASTPTTDSDDSGNVIHGIPFTESETLNGEPERVNETARKGERNARGERQELFNEDVMSDSASKPRTEPKRRRAPKADDPQGFADCWEHYPRKDNRKGARTAYGARLSAGEDPKMLLAATKNYAQATQGKDRQFVMLGSTFFGPNDRFRDYLGPRPGNPPDQPGRGIGYASALENGGARTVPDTPEWRARMGFPVGATPA